MTAREARDIVERSPNEWPAVARVLAAFVRKVERTESLGPIARLHNEDCIARPSLDEEVTLG